MVSRVIYQSLQEELFAGKALLVLGPRQAGKTTLLKKLINDRAEPSVWMNCDEPDVRRTLQEPTSTLLSNLIGDATLVVIDEAQRVKNIGLTLKLITDQLPSVQLIATGSSSLELANEINEPLTGRKIEYLCEFKWNQQTKARFPPTFLNAYPNSTTQTITPDNYTDWLTS